MDLVSVSNAGAPPPAAGQSITSIPVVQVVTSQQPGSEFSAPTVATMRVVKPVVVATGTTTGTGQVKRPQLVSVVRGQTIGPNGKGQARALPVVKMPLGSMAAVTSSMFVIRPRQPSPEPTQAEVEAFRARSLADPTTVVMPGQTIGAEEDCQTTLQEFVPEPSVLDPETGLLVPAPPPPQPPQSQAQPQLSQAPEVQLHPSMLVSQPPVVVHPEVVYELQPSDSLAEAELRDSPAATSYSAASSQEPMITLSCGSSYAAEMGKALTGDSSETTEEHTQDTADVTTEDTDAFDNTLTIDSAAVAVAGDEDGDEDDVPLATRKRKTPSRGRGRPRKRPRTSSATKAPPAPRAPPPFSCDDCEERFSDRLALAAHERQHGDEKHTCVECRQTFAYPLALRRHKLRHGKAGRPRTGRRRTKAPSRYVDADWGELGIGRSRSGARSEEMVTCGVCDEELAPEEVADHIAPPTGITYFRCEQCGGAFGQRCQLSRHGCHSGGNRRRAGKGGKAKTNTRVAATLAVVMKREASEEEAEEDVDEPQEDTGTEWEVEEGADSIADSAAGGDGSGDGDAGVDDPLSLVLDVPTEGGGGDGHLTCDVCQINFVSKRNLMRHRAQHQGGTRYSCEVCEQSYARLDDLSRHSRSAHNQKRQYKCTRCTRSFTQRRIVTYHMRSHDVAKDSKGPKKEPVMDDGTDYPGPGPVKYTCEQCGAGFDTRRRYTRHQQLRHDAESPKYECEVCNATYARIDELTRHTIQVHHQKKTVPCPRCTRLFTQQRIVDYHVRGHDTKRVYNLAPRPYKCEECERSFRTEELLTDHICRTKTSVTRCVCDICGRGISCPQALRRHRLQHNEERPAKCQTCGAAFIDDVALSKHVLTHSEEKPFLCDHCGKGFRFKDYLVRHTRFHTGEKPYQCSACDKSFATSDTLNRHYLIHTGEKPYVCEICARPFRQAQQLKTHMKVHRKREIPYLDHDSREEAQTFDLRHADVPVPGNCSDMRFIQDERGEVTFVEEVCGEVTETTVLDVQMADEQTRSDLRLVGSVAGQV